MRGNFPHCHRRMVLKVVGPKKGLWKKNISMILRLETILLVVSHERKNIICYEKNFKLMKHNIFNKS